MHLDWPHFTFGALAGLFLGLYLWTDLFDATPHTWPIIPLTTLTVGFLAGKFADDFWHHAADILRWP